MSKDTVYALLPAYREENRIGPVVADLLKHPVTPLVVDDGSDDNTAGEAEAAGATVIRYTPNRGKGAALKTGFEYALEHECRAVITMDSDGQHSPEDIPGFLETLERTGAPVLVGNRMSDTRDMPLIRPSIALISPLHAQDAKPNVLMISIDDLNDWTGYLGGYPSVSTKRVSTAES